MSERVRRTNLNQSDLLLKKQDFNMTVTVEIFESSDTTVNGEILDELLTVETPSELTHAGIIDANWTEESIEIEEAEIENSQSEGITASIDEESDSISDLDHEGAHKLIFVYGEETYKYDDSCRNTTISELFSYIRQQITAIDKSVELTFELQPVKLEIQESSQFNNAHSVDDLFHALDGYNISTTENNDVLKCIVKTRESFWSKLEKMHSHLHSSPHGLKRKHLKRGLNQPKKAKND